MSTDTASARRTAHRRSTRPASLVLLRLPDAGERRSATKHEGIPRSEHRSVTGVQAATTIASRSATETATVTPETESLYARAVAWLEGGGGNILTWIIIGILALALAAWIQRRTPTPDPTMPSPPTSPAAAEKLPRLHDPRTVESAPAQQAANVPAAPPVSQAVETPPVPQARITGMRPLAADAPAAKPQRRVAEYPEASGSRPGSTLGSRLEKTLENKGRPSNTPKVAPTIYR